MKRGWFKGERVDVVVVCGTLCFCHLQPGWRRTPTAGPKAGIQHGLLQRGVGGCRQGGCVWHLHCNQLETVP